ncbi:TPA: hypothetical protein DEP34_04560 [Candidatus Uhrbacteria bacterium]|nr:hypothetical protein [Candidatus Uhrbacteria bacterium]HCB19619.1 hypothetical protein [Candidatus Uhrbacteria bacterium]
MFSDFIESYQEIISAILGIISSVLAIEIFLPLSRNKKRKAKIKLDNFYTIAYAFVKMREDFSVSIADKIHNKENCGWFHSFNFDQIPSASEKTVRKNSGIVFDEQEFFEYTVNNFNVIDDSLRSDFIEYFKVRGPESVSPSNLKCENSKLIRLRKKIEIKIINSYKKYSRIASSLSVVAWFK